VALNDTLDDDKGTRYLQTAAVFLDPRTGDIRALVGGRDYNDSEYNRALYAQRQPGSAFKPFVYATAFEAGYSPEYRLVDQPLRIMLARNKAWEPKNYDGNYAGVVSLRDALAQSRNVPTIRLAMELGVDRVISTARQMGLTGRIPAVPSVVLGSAEVTPMNLASAYAGFDNLGERPSVARFVTKVVDKDGNVVWSQEPRTEHVLDPAVAFMTVSLMQDVVDRGTATAVRAVGYSDPAAGKTGTTNDAADVWFIGMTPDLMGAIWMGFDQRQTIVAHASGGEMVAPVWGRVMARIGARSTGWTPPAGVELRMVDQNGNVVGENCPVVGVTKREYFLTGTAPEQTCYPAYGQYSMTDSTGYPVDTAAYATQQENEHWWQKMRERIFGKHDTVSPLPSSVDTVNRTIPAQQTPAQYPAQVPTQNPNSLPAPPVKPKPKPVPYDSLVKQKQDTTVKPDTIKHDTIELR
jgi:penicillin-binding protein 1A